MPDNVQLQIGCQEGELVITPKWIRVHGPGQPGGWMVLRSNIVEVGTTPAAEDHLCDITIRARNGEWHAHKLASEQAESVRDLLDCSPPASAMTLGPDPALAGPTAPAHELEPTVPPSPFLPLPAAKIDRPGSQLRVACRGGTLVITDKVVTLLGEHTRDIPRAAVVGVTSQPRSGNRADLVVYSKIEGQLKAELLVPGVVPLDTLHVIERLGYMSGTDSTGEKPPRPATDGQPLQATRPARAYQSEPRPRGVSRHKHPRARRQRIGLAGVVLAGVCLIVVIADLVFNGLNAPEAVLPAPMARATVSHSPATTVTPTATLNVLEPVPLTFTCATAVSQSYGRVCVHTLPGTALTITVTYCSGFGSAENSSTLHGTSYADRNGNYTWNWVPQTDCRENATVYVAAQSDGQRGYYVYDLPVT